MAIQQATGARFTRHPTQTFHAEHFTATQHDMYLNVLNTCSPAGTPAVRHLLPIHAPPLRPHRLVAPPPLSCRRRPLLRAVGCS